MSFFMSHSAQEKYAERLLVLSQGTGRESIGPFVPALKFAFTSLSSSGVLLSQTGEIQGGRGPVQRDSDSCS